ncbi:MAG: putative baseplate assembly protein [Gammaproteobacteria bacterium]|nr:putative baseplate assembly protein [Gammaproteobacteria bacterium]
MSDTDFAHQLSSQEACGCCSGISNQAPVRIHNRPGLSAIAYRIGDHADVLASLLARLSSKDYPALAKLRTRDSDDFSIALLDAYAGMADVLTFYQERIANESYLRTADERFSLQEMARLIGYRLNPGVAAETYLAFTMEEAEGAPQKVKLEAGIKVQSVPGQDEKPQTFETVNEIEARREWNLLKPKMSEIKVPVLGTEIVYLQGTATLLKAGDALLFVGSERETDTGSERWDFRRIQSLVIDNNGDTTIVTLERGLGSLSPHIDPSANPKIYAMRLRSSLFGHNAPDWRVMSDEIKRGYLGLGPGETITDTEWPGFTIADISDPPTSSATGTGLYGEYFNNKDLTRRKLSRTDATVNFDWGTGSPDPSIGAGTFSVRWTGWVQTPSTGTYTFYTESDDGVRLWVNDQLVINNWSVHGVTEDSGSISLNSNEKYNIRLEFYENTGLAVIKLYWAPPGQSKQIIPQGRLYPRNIHTLHLDSTFPQIVPESWLVLSVPEYQEVYQVETVGEDSRASFTLTGKTTRLVVKGENLREIFNEQVRETAVFANSEHLSMAEAPITSDVSGSFLTVSKKVDGLKPDHKLVLSGVTTAGSTTSEVVTLAKTEPDGAATKLFFTSSLQHNYKRDTVKIYANVALATHGETMHQILGSGEARKAHQRFSLKHAPLTFVSAENESGAETALEVRVNNIAWHETSSLFEAKPTDRSYVVRVDEEGAGEVQFGDGQLGGRLPTGQENVHAIYRKGIGSVGNLKAGQLSRLLTRPLGLKEVTNPQASSGGVDSELVNDARRNMPLGVRTLGRAVSLQDYEDFARAYTGIAKAQANVLDIRGSRTIFITIAGKNAVQPETDGLLGSLKKNSDPFVACDAAAFNEAYFKLALRIKRHPDHDIDIVLADVEAALRKAFSFEARDFGQTVPRSELINVAQQVSGVEGVDVDRFYRGITVTLEDHLAPATASVDSNGDGVAAELLLLDPGPLDYLEEMP